MSYKIKNIFGKESSIVIGAIHFPPLSGYPDFPGLEVALSNALADLRAFEAGGVDAVFIENNYDVPHTSTVTPEVTECLLYLGEKIKNASKLPVGISVLWNDYRTALFLAHKLGLAFIRVPVFVDTVKTTYGVMEGNPEDVIAYRKSIGAESVVIFTDIHVKHAEILSEHSIEESALLAIEKGSDGLIITGKWTGDAPDLNELESVRSAVGVFPIFCGSGVDEGNVKKLFTFANGAIVSTSLKDGGNDAAEVNVKVYTERIDREKVLKLIGEIK